MNDTRCQWSVGDECFVRIYDRVVKCIIRNVDIPTRRLKLIYPDGVEAWAYMEHVWRE